MTYTYTYITTRLLLTYVFTVLTQNYTPFEYNPPPYLLLKYAAEVYLSLI